MSNISHIRPEERHSSLVPVASHNLQDGARFRISKLMNLERNFRSDKIVRTDRVRSSVQDVIEITDPGNVATVMPSIDTSFVG